MKLANEEYFKKYRSNTYASSCNNHMLNFEREKTITGRAYFKLIKHGTYNYRLFFSNIVDSTFADGQDSRANLCGDDYEIISAYIGTAPDMETEPVLKPLLFGGTPDRSVLAAETFWSDETELSVKEGEYFVFECTVKGKRMAYPYDRLYTCLTKNEMGEFVPDAGFPRPNLIGCDADFKKNLAFIGDSITMGCGTTVDAYAYWAAKIGKGLGDDYSVWDIGLGYARGHDAATKGIWLERAKQYDFVNVCFGVNDIYHGEGSVETLLTDLNIIVDELNSANVRVCLFNIPAFDWEGENRDKWDTVNDYIENVLSKKVAYVFDMAGATGKPEDRYRALTDPHPTDEGGSIIAEKYLAQNYEI